MAIIALKARLRHAHRGAQMRSTRPSGATFPSTKRAAAGVGLYGTQSDHEAR